MIRRVIWLIPIVLLAANAFLGIRPGDYHTGYDQAVHDLQEARQKMGWASDIGGSILDRIEYLPPEANRSEKWQEGYRQALRDHFTR